MSSRFNRSDPVSVLPFKKDLKDSYAAAHSVYSDKFYTVIHLPARSKICVKMAEHSI